MLPRSLTSVKSFVDEIIVVDTGSTDKSIEIAKSFGAIVYEHTWDPWDFSAARNKAMEYCSSEWIFIIDADEELVFNPDVTMEKIKEWLDLMPKENNAAAIRLYDIQKGRVVMEMNTARFFRKGFVRYDGSVHNQPQVTGTGLFLPGAYIRHYGYDLSPEQMDKKEQRTRTLLLKRIEDNPKDYNAFFYMTELYGARGNAKEAVEWGEKYISHKDEMEETFNPCLYYTIMHNHIALGNMKRAEEILQMGLRECRDDMDLSYGCMEFGLHSNNRDKAFIGARKYFKLLDMMRRNPAMSQGKFNFTSTPEAFCFAAFQHTVNCIKEGFFTLSLFEQGIVSAAPDYRDAIVSDLKKELATLGIEVSLSYGEKNNTVGLPNAELMKELEEL
jgi:glycosyltransferase involved in cell wall biosynthesis